MWYPTGKKAWNPLFCTLWGVFGYILSQMHAELPPGPATCLTSPSREQPKLKEARHVPEDFAGRCIMKVSLRRCAEKPLCDVLFDILVKLLEKLSWRRPSILTEGAERLGLFLHGINNWILYIIWLLIINLKSRPSLVDTLELFPCWIRFFFNLSHSRKPLCYRPVEAKSVPHQYFISCFPILDVHCEM